MMMRLGPGLVLAGVHSTLQPLQSPLNINPCALTVSAIQIFTTLSSWTLHQRGTIIEEAGNITDNTRALSCAET